MRRPQLHSQLRPGAVGCEGIEGENVAWLGGGVTGWWVQGLRADDRVR